MLLDGICSLLRSYGDIEVIGQACERIESIAKVEELSPDIVLMETDLSGTNGLEPIRRIKKRSAGVKILALITSEGKEHVSSVIRTGVDGCITMKASGSELVDAIKIIHRGNLFLSPFATRILVEDYIRTVEINKYDLLTPREKQTLKLIAEGYRGRNIAAKLGIGVKTVYGHRGHLLKKLDLRNITDLIKFAMKNRLVTTRGMRDGSIRD